MRRRATNAPGVIPKGNRHADQKIALFAPVFENSGEIERERPGRDSRIISGVANYSPCSVASLGASSGRRASVTIISVPPPSG